MFINLFVFLVFVCLFCVCLCGGILATFSENLGFLHGFLGKWGGNLRGKWVFINLFVFLVFVCVFCVCLCVCLFVCLLCVGFFVWMLGPSPAYKYICVCSCVPWAPKVQ